MRTPINQAPINGVSGGVWTEAPALVSEAGASCVTLRTAYTGASVAQVSASTPPSVFGRTARSFGDLQPVDAEALGSALRTAWQFSTVELSAEVDIRATRYARTGASPAMVGTAHREIEDSAVFVIAITRAEPVRCSAISWSPDSKVDILPVRLRKFRGDRLSTATIRLLPNTTIGQGVAEGVSETVADDLLFSIWHDFRSSVSLSAATSLFGRRSIVGVEGSSFGSADLVYNPTVFDFSEGVRISSFFATCVSQASSLADNIRYVPLIETLVRQAELNLQTYKWRIYEGWSASAAELVGDYWTFVRHPVTSSIAASAFLFYGPETYRLRWSEATLQGWVADIAKAINLRWVGMSGVSDARASCSTDAYNESYPLFLSFVQKADALAENKVYRPSQGVAQAGVIDNSNAYIGAFTGGSCLAEAPLGAAVDSRGVRWARHGAVDSFLSNARSSGTYFRVRDIWSYPIHMQAHTDATSVANRFVFGVPFFAEGDSLSTNYRARVVYSEIDGVVDATFDDLSVYIYSLVYFDGVAVSEAAQVSQGVMFVPAEATPRLADASTIEFVFRINAATDAPITRTIPVVASDRLLYIQPVSREYFAA